MRKQDISKLNNKLDEIGNPNSIMVYKDLFAIGCFLHATGNAENKRAGRKVVDTVLSAIGYETNKTYFRAILNSLEGNEIEYGRGIDAHAEIESLLDSLAEE